jgi:hypothetical protein
MRVLCGGAVELPLRYMSPEQSIRADLGKPATCGPLPCSYGNVTLGNIPYFDITNDRELIEFVTSGGLLSRDQMTCE